MTTRTYKPTTREKLLEVNGSRRVRSPSIHALAAYINASGKYTAIVDRAEVTKERRTPGRTYVNARWEVEGNRLTVRDTNGISVYSHNTAETYSELRSVVRWIVKNIVEAR